MSFAADLLEQANYLARREPTRPKQASLRRAVSAAYYAVFHLINEEAVLLLAPNLSPERRAGVQRWFSHTETKKVCQTFLSANFPQPLALAGFAISANLQVIARNFIRLQEARHQADYDLSSTWTRLRAQQQVALAEQVFSSWELVRGTEEVNIFILSLLLWDQFKKERVI